MSNSWKNSLYPPNATIGDAIEAINAGGYDIALVIDADRRLLGTVTDGDVRRGFIAGLDRTAPITKVMNDSPFTEIPGVDRTALLDKMNSSQLRQVPLLDGDGRIVGLVHIRELTPPVEVRSNTVVLMAGGLGQRLQPLTNNTPKPLLNVGEKPILETILESFVEQKFGNFYIAVNYRASDIIEYFGDGSKWNVNIRYLQEEKRLGTAGALTLMPERATAPVIVMNGDLLTRFAFQDLLDYHEQQLSSATMCVRQYDIQVPFGVVQTDGQKIRMIDEKPVQRFLVNAGVYVLNPDVLELIPHDQYFDMTELFGQILGDKLNTAAFPIYEYWLDVGRMDDLKKANVDYKNGAHH